MDLNWNEVHIQRTLVKTLYRFRAYRYDSEKITCDLKGTILTIQRYASLSIGATFVC
ncbi:hypothetical protein AB3N59_02105 [Leptospira sp. WS92.C1]